MVAAEELHTFKRIQLSDQFWCEGANFGDLNNDGLTIHLRSMVVGGARFQSSHEFYSSQSHLPTEARADDLGHCARIRGTLGAQEHLLR